MNPGRSSRSIEPYLVAAGVALLSVAIRVPLEPWLGPTRAVFLIPFCAISFVAVVYGFFPAFVTLLLSLFSVVLFVLPPRFTLKVDNPEVVANVLTFAVGAFVCSLLGHFVYRTRAARDDLAQQLENTVANAGTGLTRCSRDLRYTMVNPAYAKLVGKPAEEIVGKYIVDVLGEEATNIIRPYIDRVLKGEAVEYQTELPMGDRGLRLLNIHYSPELGDNGEAIGWIASVDDITGQKAAEVVHARLAAVVNSSHDAIISKNLDTTITSWNAAAEKLFGYTAEEAIGKSIRILIPDDRQDEETDIIGRIGRGESVEHYETLRRRKDGSLVNIALTVSPIRDANGHIIGASKIARDITEQKAAEKRIADDLRAMSRLRTIGSMASSIDCDLDLCLEAILDAAIDFTQAAKGNIHLIGQERDAMQMRFHSGFGPSFLAYYEKVDAGHDSACGTALRRLQRIVVDDIRKSDIFIGKRSLKILLDEGILAVQSTPLISSKGVALGVISTHFDKTHRPGERELGLLDLLARQTSEMLERHNAQLLLEQEVAERTRELHDAISTLVAKTSSDH